MFFWFLYFEDLSVEIYRKGGCMNQKHQNVPIWEKANLTLEEAAAFTNIGINKLRQLTDEDGCEYVLWIGSKRLIKRKKLEEFLEHAESL